MNQVSPVGRNLNQVSPMQKNMKHFSSFHRKHEPGLADVPISLIWFSTGFTKASCRRFSVTILPISEMGTQVYYFEVSLFGYFIN
jgi:hypothetical protein